MTQLSFDLPLPERFGTEDFLVSPSNALAYETIAAWPDWPDRVLVLLGPAGSGKSHLAALWTARTGARPVGETDVDGSAGRPASPAAVMDGADSAGWSEAGLFHYLNRVREHGAWLLVTARRPPDQWGLGTPDLLSRLRLAPTVSIGPPGEPLVRAVLVKLFAERQLSVDEQLVEYLAFRIDRSLDAARAVVDRLDAASLGSGRRIGRALASDVLRDLRLEAD